MQRAGTNEIVDLCSGASGPLLAVQRHMQAELGFETGSTLTDLYPNAAAFAAIASSGRARPWHEPVSAFDMPPTLTGIRTLFTAFHHFRPEDAIRILADARSKRRAIAIFEPFERTLRMTLLLGIVGPPGMVFRTHKIGPLTWPRFVLSYVLPIAPLIATWDGVVSTLRAYTVEELRELAVAAGSSGYAWEAGRVTYDSSCGVMALTYLIGVPG
jgi:hypothetical protein